jgi:hypothetical protein
LSSLARFQENFVRGLTAAPPLPGIFSTPAFAVYRNTWRKALVGALRDAYPVVAALIGRDAFQALALHFIGKRAAPSPILAAWGEGFAEFISTHAISESLPYLADVGRLERLGTEVHLGPDAEPLDPALCVDFLEAATGDHIALHPSVRFAWFETPAVTIWEAHQGPGQLEAFAPDWVPQGALVTRPRGAVVVTPIDRVTCHLLAAMRPSHGVLAAAKSTRSAHPGADISAILLLVAKAGGFMSLGKKRD